MAPPAPLPPRVPVRLLTSEYTFFTAGATTVVEAFDAAPSDDALDGDRPNGSLRAAGLVSSSASSRERGVFPLRADDGVTRCGVLGVRLGVLAAVRLRLVGLEKGEVPTSPSSLESSTLVLAIPRFDVPVEAARDGERVDITT